MPFHQARVDPISFFTLSLLNSTSFNNGDFGWERGYQLRVFPFVLLCISRTTGSCAINVHRIWDQLMHCSIRCHNLLSGEVWPHPFLEEILIGT